MNSEPVIRVAAAVIRDARGRMLVVRKREDCGVHAAGRQDHAGVDPANPGDIELAPLTRLLIAEAVTGGRD